MSQKSESIQKNSGAEFIFQAFSRTLACATEGVRTGDLVAASDEAVSRSNNGM
jgi:hypothetical protein